MVDILVSNYNSGDAIQLCVESIRKYTPPETYKLIVFNDLCKNGKDAEYLRFCRDRGWLDLYETDVRLHHGGVLNQLMNKICTARRAVLIDCDTQITGTGWMADGFNLMEPDVLAVCDERAEPCVTAQGYAPGFYRAWFAFFNMDAYRDGMQVNWMDFFHDATVWPYTDMYKHIQDYPKPEGCNPALSCEDPGSRLWMKVHYDNPKRYRVVPLTPILRAKHIHYGHVAYFYDLPDDFDNYTRVHKQARAALITSRLMHLRNIP